MGVCGGILLFSPTVWAGSGGERRDTRTGTRTGTYTRMLHLPFSDLPLKKCPRKEGQGAVLQGAVKGVYLKGLSAQSRLFYREMNCPVLLYREMDCPVRWSLATPSALESQSRAEQGSVVANPICKCGRHKAGHLHVRAAVGR